MGISGLSGVLSAGFGLEARGLPGQDAAGQMGVVGIALLLRGQRGGDRSPSRTAGEHDLPALRVRDRGRIEAGQRAPPRRPDSARARPRSARARRPAACGPPQARGRLPRGSDREHGDRRTIRHAVLLAQNHGPPYVPRIWHAHGARSNGHLRADLHHPVGRNLEIVGRIIGDPRQQDEQPVLPPRHAGMGGRLAARGATGRTRST